MLFKPDNEEKKKTAELMIVYLYTHRNQSSDEQIRYYYAVRNLVSLALRCAPSQITSKFHVERRYNCIDSELVISFSILSACRHYRLVTTTGLVKVFRVLRDTYGPQARRRSSPLRASKTTRSIRRSIAKRRTSVDKIDFVG